MLSRKQSIQNTIESLNAVAEELPHGSSYKSDLRYLLDNARTELQGLEDVLAQARQAAYYGPAHGTDSFALSARPPQRSHQAEISDLEGIESRLPESEKKHKLRVHLYDARIKLKSLDEDTLAEARQVAMSAAKVYQISNRISPTRSFSPPTLTGI